ncbi:Ankyrin repeat domain-containing protein 50 [Zalerion maritima]|uniref:Ankyrin repeat domain-containing protein 50 n=1 Tax=Zalerion maritima TaxID=339359 RepID=A0AAD5RKW5_9PEZI|nr:Ankyrin repeat domain-containing protein 50 [Zalerion maritima]
MIPAPGGVAKRKREPRGPLAMEKCHYCRKAKRKCQPQMRQWPAEKCERCIEKGLTCSAPERAAREPKNPRSAAQSSPEPESNNVAAATQDDSNQDEEASQLLTSIKILHILKFMAQELDKELSNHLNLFGDKTSISFDLFLYRSYGLKLPWLVARWESALEPKLKEFLKRPSIDSRKAKGLQKSSLLDAWYMVNTESKARTPFFEHWLQGAKDCGISGESGIISCLHALLVLHEGGYRGCLSSLSGLPRNVSITDLIGKFGHAAVPYWEKYRLGLHHIQEFYDEATTLPDEPISTPGRPMLLPDILLRGLCHFPTGIRGHNTQKELFKDTRDVFGRTPLHVAAQANCHEQIRELCTGGVINNETFLKSTALHYAAAQGHVEACTALLDLGADFDAKDFSRRIPIYYAARNGHGATLAILSQHLTRPSWLSGDDDEQDRACPLRAAIEGGQTSIVLSILDGCLGPLSNFKKEGLVGWVARRGSVEVVRLLTKQTLEGAQWLNVNSRDARGWAPLHIAVWYRGASIAETLLEDASIDVNVRIEGLKWTPLIMAALDGKVECLSLLLRHADVQVNSATWAGDSPLTLAARHGKVECLSLLLQHVGIQVNLANRHGDTPLLSAVKASNLESVQVLCEREDINIYARDTGGKTPLESAEENMSLWTSHPVRRAEYAKIVGYLRQRGTQW